MAKSLISWVVVGVLIFVWWWVGYDWNYLQDIPRGDWKPIWVLFTILTLIVLRHTGAPAAGGGNVVEAVIGRIKDVVPHLLGLAVALLVGDAIYSLMMGGFITNELIQAVAVAVGSAVTTAAWLGATEDASR
jgi:hypothetical protein